VRFPVLDALRRHSRDVLIGLGARITEISWIYLITILGLSYAVTNVGRSRSRFRSSGRSIRATR